MGFLLNAALVVLALVGVTQAAEYKGLVTFGGLPLPGATVTAIGAAGQRQSTVTDLDGGYLFADLPPGDWRVRVEMQCFTPQERNAAGLSAMAWDMKLLSLADLATHRVTQTQDAAPPPTPEAAATPQPKPPPKSDEDAADLNERAADGLLINGSANNGASTPFALAPAFGNFRKGPGSLYNASLGITTDLSALDARSYSLTGQDTPKPSYTRLTGLLAFGGPIRIPHLIRNGPNVTINYQWTRNSTVTTQPGLVPTAAQRQGDLGSLGAIPLSRITPQALALLKLYPAPNFAGSSRYNYQAALTGATHQDSLQARVNKSFGRREQLFGSLEYTSTRSDATNLFAFLDTTDVTGVNAAANWRHALTPRMSFILGAQFNRLGTTQSPYFSRRSNISGDAGIAGNSQDPANWGPPTLTFSSGISSLSDGPYSVSRSQTTALTASSFWGLGRHNLSYGFDLRRQQFNQLGQQEPRGTFAFTGTTDFTKFLTGAPDAATLADGNADKYFRSWFSDAYFTDDWRVTPGFTVNAGARWEYGSPIRELYGRLANLDVGGGFSTVAPVLATHSLGTVTGRSYPAGLMEPDRSGFQPRIGISWRPMLASSLVIRGGYGVYYNTSAYLMFAAQMAQQPPLSRALSVQSAAAAPLTPATGFETPSAATGTFGIDPDFRVGYSQNWQLSAQRDLPGALVLSATYAGGKGTRGVQAFLPNTYPTGGADPCPACPRGFTYVASNGNSARHSGQVEIRRRLRAGITGKLQYTFAKSIDNSTLGGRGQGASLIAQNWLDLRAERGLSNFDQRHALTAQLQYTTGMGSRGRLLAGRIGELFREWTVAGLVTAGSGLPLTPVFAAPVTGTGITGSLRPDYTGAVVRDAPAGLFLNPLAYTAPAAGRWGNAGRNSIIGPGQFVTTASIGRTFRRGDRLNLDVRVDAANALNQVTWSSWGIVSGSAQFGVPTGANSMRTLQTTIRVRY